ncbi:DegT/DnrJ/EryC1/StrS family aminotransferase [Turicibacter sanguinis]|uniref:DegT/DnrJ/EryC1/StrS family aminotransferase n=1 Tax=Turicibacter sanguinis TaxID=154288 RepID=UPI0018AC6981|nr:DegT/DnrJ/EryC1/StrS family aminotransferase [Turicibacter sanguinis]MDB8558393.1 DegT/DnrJ/EryC1/StrS family aminotransferase [Turicibacter sanguinis]MDB8561189.1 DegT/DnrJ/EryC1/StrS family aminotransferase [Turicibacter sanguinis]
MGKRIYLASPHMGGAEQAYVAEAFETNWVAPLGPNVNEFEKELAHRVGTSHAAALSSGTAAIHLGLKALGVSPGDVVFCSTLTFSASCNPIIYEGATPVFIDSEINSWNMSPNALRKAFEDYTPKAVVVVHLYGQSADMDEIKAICDEHRVPILEDAAESLGATYKGQASGTHGEIGIYSFNGNKIITTSGGGMMISNHQAHVEKARFWATQAREATRHYEHKELGYNNRMSNVLAGIGRGQLQVLETRIQQKKAIFKRYEEAFKEIEGLNMMPIREYGEPNYWLSCAILDAECQIKPLDIILALEAENIESRPIWKPMHLQPIFKDYPYYMDDNQSVSEDVFNRGICLPSDTKMTIEEQEYVIEIIKSLFKGE